MTSAAHIILVTSAMEPAPGPCSARKITSNWPRPASSGSPVSLRLSTLQSGKTPVAHISKVVDWSIATVCVPGAALPMVRTTIIKYLRPRTIISTWPLMVQSLAGPHTSPIAQMIGVVPGARSGTARRPTLAIPCRGASIIGLTSPLFNMNQALVARGQPLLHKT